jgi:hypothetical protein
MSCSSRIVEAALPPPFHPFDRRLALLAFRQQLRAAGRAADEVVRHHHVHHVLRPALRHVT